MAVMKRSMRSSALDVHLARGEVPLLQVGVCAVLTRLDHPRVCVDSLPCNGLRPEGDANRRLWNAAPASAHRVVHGAVRLRGFARGAGGAGGGFDTWTLRHDALDVVFVGL